MERCCVAVLHDLGCLVFEVQSMSLGVNCVQILTLLGANCLELKMGSLLDKSLVALKPSLNDVIEQKNLEDGEQLR